jgi:Delta7-sterol 5-desaturase
MYDLHMGDWSAVQLLALGWIAVGKFLTIAGFERLTSRTRSHTVVAGEITRAQRRRELSSLWLTPMDAALLYLGSATGVLHLGPESLLRAVATFALFFVWVEIWFYWSHVALHRSDTLWRFHRHHHLSQIPTPLTGASFSVVEKLFVYSLPWVGFVTLLSLLWPVSFWGITLYYVVYYFSSPLAHSNREARPAIMHRIFGFRWFATPSGHAIHHAASNANFGFFTNVFDQWLGTAHPDTEAIYHQARAGTAHVPLSKLTS